MKTFVICALSSPWSPSSTWPHGVVYAPQLGPVTHSRNHPHSARRPCERLRIFVNTVVVLVLKVDIHVHSNMSLLSIGGGGGAVRFVAVPTVVLPSRL